jgi:small subunit ribosomal protein S24e
MTYMLFGAYNLEVSERGLVCDGWLPIVGNLDALDDIQRLKTLLDQCMLRVFEGISKRNRQRHTRDVEAESGDDEGVGRVTSLSATEVKELDIFTRDIVRILNRFSEERIASQSRNTSRAATPMGSPSSSSVRLPSAFQGPSWPTPRSTYHSRPSTPSRLSWRT